MILNWELFLEFVGEKPINNIDLYNSKMGLSLSDKKFFINLIKFDVIVDFGCADGRLLKEIHQINPSIKLIGYDIDENMIKISSKNLKGIATITSDWNEIIKIIKPYKSPLLNLSSVIHEVYSYSNSNTIKSFWDNKVFSGNFKYIAIRDMIPSSDIHKNEISNFKNDIKKVRKIVNPKQLLSFENIWGSINDNYRTFVHFLLKYKYVENWEREVRENYLPVSIETLKKKIPSRFKIVFEDNFILPYLKNEIKKDFEIEITHTTHTKMIIERK